MLRSDSVTTRTHDVKCEVAAEVLRYTGQLRLRVTGWSMLPAILPGDTLVLESAISDGVCEGDIVLFHRERRFFVHRVIGKARDKRELFTRGDAMPQADAAVGHHELLGRVSCIVRNGESIAPSRRRTWPQRALTAVLQRSKTAARVVVAAHNIHQSS